jgi:hypothetical protein
MDSVQHNVLTIIVSGLDVTWRQVRCALVTMLSTLCFCLNSSLYSKQFLPYHGFKTAYLVYRRSPTWSTGKHLRGYAKYKNIIINILFRRPPLWPSDQSSWLQIRRPGFDSLHYQKKKVVVLERGPFSLVSTTEELLDRKVAAPV